MKLFQRHLVSQISTGQFSTELPELPHDELLTSGACQGLSKCFLVRSYSGALLHTWLSHGIARVSPPSGILSSFFYAVTGLEIRPMGYKLSPHWHRGAEVTFFLSLPSLIGALTRKRHGRSAGSVFHHVK